MSQKHFNKATVWGNISEVTWKETNGKTRYLRLKLLCKNGMYGNAVVYAKLWGTQQLGLLTANHKHHPNALYKFTGFFGQYEKQEKFYNSFNFYEWQEVEKKVDGRAAFILVGEIMGVENDKLHLHIKRGNGQRDIEEEFQLWGIDSEVFSESVSGDLIKVKGIVCPAEDYYGDSDGDIKPHVTEVKVL